MNYFHKTYGILTLENSGMPKHVNSKTNAGAEESVAMNDEILLQTVRNSLMIVGHEMGPVGDHWPAIHAISKGVEEEFEQKDRDAAVVGELEFHIANALRELEDAAEQATPDMKAKIREFVDGMWQRYYAILEPVDSRFEPSLEDLLGSDVSCVRNMRAASHLISSLGGRA
jgi:hypothetical protein